MAEVVAPSAIPTLEMTTDESANAPNIGQVTAIQKPSWVPDKFYDAKTGVINFEQLTRSYSELERSKSGAAPAAEKLPDPAAAPAAKAPVVVPPTFTVPGVEAAQLSTFTTELQTTGKLSEASYAALAKAGYTKDVVDPYVRGLFADAEQEQAVSQALIADGQIAEITASVGGKEQLTQMQKWAVSAMSQEDLVAYNAAVSSKDVATVKLAVAGLKQSYEQANGIDPAFLQGGNPDGGEAGDRFASRNEATEAIRDPRYARDEAYRNKVAAKLGRSQI